MKVITLNVNGIRSAFKKGFFKWLIDQNPDIICLQEIRADLESIPLELLNWTGYHSYFKPAQKKGYSGVAIFSKNKPDNIIDNINNIEIDNEGRYLQIDFPNYSIVSLYLPSGSSGEQSQQKKFRFLDHYFPILSQKINSAKEYIICGDFNIAHNEIDLKNWRGNLKNSGFLPEERSWLTQALKLGFLDTWRTLYPDIPGYTWWSNRGQAYNKDVGWRIDYQIITPGLAKQLISAEIFKNIKFSDHAPLITNYSI